MNIYLVLLPENGLDSSSDFYGAFSTIEQAKSVVEAGRFTWAKIIDHDTMDTKLIGVKEEGVYKWSLSKDFCTEMEYPQAPHMLAALIEKRELMIMNTHPLEETKKGNRL